jgi:hypothetical protein
MDLRVCIHCKESFDIEDKSKGWMANHVRWCHKNPKRSDYNKALTKARQCARTPEARKKTGETIKQLHASGRYDERNKKTKGKPGKKHTKETKQLLREKALKSKHRRLKKNTILWNGVLFDSSWELSLAKRLDELGIQWIRPEPIPWIDSDGVTHNYFPDFYLTDYDLYLDPKNPQAYKVQINKINCLNEQYKNIVILKSLKECEEYMIE